MRDITTLKETSSKEDFDGNWKGQGSGIRRRSFDFFPSFVVCASHEFSNTRDLARAWLRISSPLNGVKVRTSRRREHRGIHQLSIPSERLFAREFIERGKWSGEWERLGRRATSATDYYLIINLIDWFVGFYTWRRGCRKLESSRSWNLRWGSWFVSG